MGVTIGGLLGTIALVTLGHTVGGGVHLNLTGVRNSDADGLAVDIASWAFGDALLGGGEGDGGSGGVGAGGLGQSQAGKGGESDENGLHFGGLEIKKRRYRVVCVKKRV